MEIPPEATTGALVRAHTCCSRSMFGPRIIPSFCTSVTTYRAQPSASRRARASQRSPPSRVQPRAASLVPRTSRPTAIRSPCSAIARAVHSGFSRAAVPRFTRRQPVARARSSDASSRIPPDSSTWMSSVGEQLGVRATAEGGVQVHQVHPLGAIALPAQRCLLRVAVVPFRPGDALDELDGLTVGHVHGREQLQVGHVGPLRGFSRAGVYRVCSQLRSSAAPTSPDFSGWNWVARSGPFSTAATKVLAPCVLQVTWA